MEYIEAFKLLWKRLPAANCQRFRLAVEWSFPGSPLHRRTAYLASHQTVRIFKSGHVLSMIFVPRPKTSMHRKWRKHENAR